MTNALLKRAAEALDLIIDCADHTGFLIPASARAVLADLRAAMADPAQDDVERVARAICVAERMNDDDPLGGWRHWIEAAEAAIDAMTPAPPRKRKSRNCGRRRTSHERPAKDPT